MATYIVTGAAGFIGSKVSSCLLEQGHKVVGIDSINDYYDVRLKEYRLKNLRRFECFEIFRIDIEDFSALEQAFKGKEIEGVFNLAARAGIIYCIENPHVYMTTNAIGTLNLLEMMLKYSVKQMTLASTSSLYAGQQMPFSESLAVNTPISPYAASKKAAEAIAYSYHFLHDLDISVVRYFTVFGPCGRPDMSIYRFIKWIAEGLPIELFGDGSQSRDFTYVDDVARGTIAASLINGYEVFNIGGGKNPRSLNDIISEIEQRLGKKAIIKRKPFHKADIDSTWADISKAERVLGWKPKISVEVGLDRTVEWYKSNEALVKEINI
jgi:UDP-glucuronate 4-epimerase